MRIGLVPVDDRPRSRRAPGMLARAAGAEVVLPPAEAIGGRETAVAPELLHEWLRDEANAFDGLVVSLDQLAHAAAVYASDVPTAVAAGRLLVLRDLRRDHPRLPVLASTLLSGPREESAPPRSWDEHAPALALLAELLERRAHGEDVAEPLSAAEEAVPVELRREVAVRRLRSHSVNLAALELAGDASIDLLVLGTPGAGGVGPGLHEKASVAGWLRRLSLGDRAQLQPGAEELTSVLLARLLNRARDQVPRVGFFCPVPGAEKRRAPREDGSVARTVLRQIRTLGADLVECDADFVLTLLPPTAGDAVTDLAAIQHADSAAAGLADEVTRLQAIGMPATIADVARPEGGDSQLVERMRSRVDLPRLGGYAGVGTAGDAVGAALAQASARHAADRGDTRAAHELYVLHRFLADWGYQAKVRGRVQRRLLAETGVPEPTAEARPSVEADIERHLINTLAQLPRYAGRYRLVPGSLRLSWGRMFDCDFQLERVDVPPAERR